jgi:acyl-CoA thioester hydrolase
MSISLKKEKVIKEWADYNGHMNLAYYIHIFDVAAEVMLNSFKMGGESAKLERRSTFVVETHTTYNQELKVGNDVDVNLLYLDHDKKRIHYKLEMINSKEKYLASTTEVISLYIDLDERKVTEFEKDKAKIMDDFILKNQKNFKKENLIFSNKLKKN